jgi:V/A-type H+-transporting ATPase subunit I
MAIVNMKKISVIGLDNNKEQVLNEIMKLGVIDISDIDIEEDSQLAGLLIKDSENAQVFEIGEKLSRIDAVIEELSAYNPTKKRLFEPKRTVDAVDYARIVGQQEEILKIIDKVFEYNNRLSELQAQENKLKDLIETLNPWKSFNVPLDITSTNNTTVLFGVIPIMADEEKLKSAMDEAASENYIEIINSDKDQYYLFVIYHYSSEDKVMDVLKTYNFNKISFNDISGTANKNIIQADHDISQIVKERKRIKESIVEIAANKHEIEVLYDYLTVEKDRKEAVGKLLKSNRVFIIEGWVPHDQTERVKNNILSKWDVVLEITQPEEDEDFPILLKNNKFVQPFEMVTELYSLPKSSEIDPTPLMSIFFVLFFGMMVSDAGYGLLMSIVAGIAIKKLKPKGLAEKLFKLVFFGGLSTLIWGAIFGGWFGDIVELVTLGAYKIEPLVFNPLDDPMRLLIWSFVLGGIHLYVGMGINAYNLIRQGNFWDALFDIGFWYILLTGIALLFGGEGFAQIGKYMVIAGVVLLILTQGRHKKGFIGKIIGGIGGLYNVTGYLSDVLSYSRLLALGLATGVIASVINTMGTLFGFNLFGIIILIIAFVAGHLFNILINALGAYVHSSRLQYVEFFGKFYEAGGKAFKPLKINTKYVEIQ